MPLLVEALAGLHVAGRAMLGALRLPGMHYRYRRNQQGSEQKQKRESEEQSEHIRAYHFSELPLGSLFELMEASTPWPTSSPT